MDNYGIIVKNQMKEFNPTNLDVVRKTAHIIIGLGNPGVEYIHTYHNLGTLFLKELQNAYGLSFKNHTSKVFKYAKNGSKIFVEPTVFMNDSGHAIQTALHYFKETPQHLLLAHDDSDLMLGNYKIDFGRGAAGHKGVASVIHALGTKDFFRLRIGIRPLTPNKERRVKASEFVLKKIKKEDLEILSHALHIINEKLFY